MGLGKMWPRVVWPEDLELNPAPLRTFLSITICRTTQHTLPNSSWTTTAIEEGVHATRAVQVKDASQSKV